MDTHFPSWLTVNGRRPRIDVPDENAFQTVSQTPYSNVSFSEIVSTSIVECPGIQTSQQCA